MKLTIDTVKKLDLFSNANNETLEVIAKLLKIKQYPKGSYIFTEEQAAFGICFLISGSVKLTKSDSMGKEHILKLVKEGSVFGEVVLFNGGNYPATSMAMIPVQVQAATISDSIDYEGNRSIGQEKPENSIYNIRNFGAKGDGITLDSPAINKAIELCSSNGGGTVLVPAGVYLSGTIHLKSNLVLHIDAGATILGSNNLTDYEGVEDVELKKRGQWYTSLIVGYKISNIEISGHGVINGNNVFKAILSFCTLPKTFAPI